MALRTGTPLVPCAIVGAEETAPLLGRVEFGAHLLGLPYLPITPTFPWLGPLGLIPAPTKWQMVFGEPLDCGGYGAEAAGDDLLVGRLTERVRAGVQRMLDEARALRKSVFLG
jgi:1-acyl-sn-glycerol-3-phosphate acyltransferase